jgi:hypothetical protein
MKHLELSLANVFLTVFLILSGCSNSPSDDAELNTAPEEVIIPEGVFEAGVSVKALWPDQKDIDNKLINMAAYGILGIRCSSCDPVLKANATGVHDVPYVRSYVIRQGSNVFAHAVLDAPVIGNKYTREIEKGVSLRTGIPEERVFVSATHTHSGPDLFGYMGGVSDRYRKKIIDSAIDSVAEAFDSMTPVKLFVSQMDFLRDLIKVKNVSGEYADFPDKDGKPQKWQYNRRGWPSRELEFTDPEIDDRLTVLEARDYMTDKSVFVMINLPSHAALVPDNTTEITRDFCGYLVDYAQNALGGTPVIYIQGTMGDVNPAFDMDVVMKTLNSNEDPDDDIDLYEGARVFGELVAEQALATMEDQTEIEQDLYISAGVVQAKIDNILMIALINVLKSSIQMDYDFSLLSGYTFDTRVNYVRLGKQVQIVTLPGEPTTHVALGINTGEHKGKNGKEIMAYKGIKPAMDAPVKVICALTSDTLIYMMPSVERLNSPDSMPGITEQIPYEEQMGLDSKLADKCRDAALTLIEADRF